MGNIKKIGIFRIKAKSIFYLSKTLMEKYNGIGISAIQVGVPIRVILARRPTQ